MYSLLHPAIYYFSSVCWAHIPRNCRLLLCVYVVNIENLNEFFSFYRCIPEESNAIPGERTERAEPDGNKLPNWQTLALVGTSLAIVLLVTLVVSLCRHNQRLKIRLRHSAEVLVPTGTRILTIPPNDDC